MFPIRHPCVLPNPTSSLRWECAAPPGGGASGASPPTRRAGEFPHAYGGAIPFTCLAYEPIPLPLGAVVPGSGAQAQHQWPAGLE